MVENENRSKLNIATQFPAFFVCFPGGVGGWPRVPRLTMGPKKKSPKGVNREAVVVSAFCFLPLAVNADVMDGA